MLSAEAYRAVQACKGSLLASLAVLRRLAAPELLLQAAPVVVPALTARPCSGLSTRAWITPLATQAIVFRHGTPNSMIKATFTA